MIVTVSASLATVSHAAMLLSQADFDALVATDGSLGTALKACAADFAALKPGSCVSNYVSGDHACASIVSLWLLCFSRQSLTTRPVTSQVPRVCLEAGGLGERARHPLRRG